MSLNRINNSDRGESDERSGKSYPVEGSERRRSDFGWWWVAIPDWGTLSWQKFYFRQWKIQTRTGQRGKVRPNSPQSKTGVDNGNEKSLIHDVDKPVNDFPLQPRRSSVDIEVFDETDEMPRIPTPDVNVYQQKKTLAQGMMDLALLSANANQLRYVLEAGRKHPYYFVNLTFIGISLILQIAVGVGLILNSRYNVKKHEDMCKANSFNNFTVVGIFIVTIVNVFISAFGIGIGEVEP